MDQNSADHNQVTASIELLYEDHLHVFTTRYLNTECGCEWVVDMWGNVRRVMVCARDMNAVRYADQVTMDFSGPGLRD